MFSTALKKGSMELLVLSLVAEESLHGYEIGKRIEERSNGRLVFRISSLYPTLKNLETRAWLSSRWVEAPGERRRRFYRITAKGRRALERERKHWELYVASVDDVLRGSI